MSNRKIAKENGMKRLRWLDFYTYRDNGKLKFTIPYTREDGSEYVIIKGEIIRTV